ncbi:MAG: amino acid ABC transporter ATP-binding protein, partial [Solobacterium sp.]|nr:amino acid ABC transporter ATP-binding protein [Solobacterium sp.]
LRIENLKKSFDEQSILENISFSIEEGTTTAILGSSGSGKTTLLRCLTLLEKADEGKLIYQQNQSYNFQKINRTSLPFRLGLVFQQFNLFPQYTALENVQLAPKLLKQNLSKEEAMSYLIEMGLEDRAHYYPYQLSGGQQQRVAIARALALKPEILCFDEPTSALDPELTQEVLLVLKKLAEKKRTMLLVTHEIEFAKNIADQVIFMDDGHIVEMGSASDVIDHPKEERTKAFLSKQLLSIGKAA